MKNCVIVGYGGMGGWHARHIKEGGAVNLAGIYDIKSERAAAAEAEGIHAYPSFEAVLADEHVDLITIATPNEWHKPLAIAALKAGKHVISEKPVPSRRGISLTLSPWQTKRAGSSPRTRTDAGTVTIR